ncbi:MAG: 2-oxoglutarate and iron-dependent oxygenase domain-containing protein, partial [Flavobacteriales bacterium]
MGIPAVDLNDFIHGDANAKSTFVSALGAAYEDIGFVAVKNHLMDEATIEKLYNQVRAFFSLEEETK